LDFFEVIKVKLEEARKHIRDGAIMVEDAGYTCSALGKIPGPFSKFFLQELGRERIYEILQKLGDTKAVHTSNIGYMDERGEIQYFTSSVKGEMVFPKGEGGFGFDPLFIPEGFSKTFAEMTDEERFAVKPRVACTKMLQEYLQKKV
jgi:non-canonical purine NTP pyrophosphatase (RdgB/HAM1 family)